MKKSDFVEVHVYVVNTKNCLGNGIIFSKTKMENDFYFIYCGTTLLTKEFWNKYSYEDEIDLSYIE
jgi:hypothetical protein